MIMPAEAMVSVARAFRFVREEPKGSNAGQAVEAFQRLTGNTKGDPWCASFVCWCLDGLLGKSNPLPLTGSCAALGDAAAEKKLLTRKPDGGDVFLLYFPSLKRFAHTGFVIDVLEVKPTTFVCHTIEGNTTTDGSREGWGVFERTREFGPADRFIHWQVP